MTVDADRRRKPGRRRIARWIGGVSLSLAVVCTFRAATSRAPAFAAGPPPVLPQVDPQTLAEHLAAAIAIPTVSLTSGGDAQHFVALHALLRERFPRAFAVLEATPIHEHSIVMRWPGSDPAARPIILIAHTDVVPVEEGPTWTQPPFSGAIADGHVWGRGAMDDKLGVIGILSAIESLARDGFVPTRDVWIGFGHDEEVGGAEGAVAIAAWLEQRGVKAQWLLDEGGAIVVGAVPGIESPIAFVGVAEKGHASLELVAQGEGGHSSMPPEGGAIVRLSEAIVRLEQSPMPADLREPTAQMIDRLAPEQTFVARLVLANRWLFDPLVERFLARHPATNATIRTTTAPTIFDAGTADNVLAARARAVVNFRVLPGETVADVETHVRGVVDGLDIDVRCVDKCWDPSPVSRIDGEGWNTVSRAIVWTWPDVIVSPTLVVGATDARHFAAVADDSYRFVPLRMLDADRARLHGTDERIAVDNLHAAVRFYQAVLVAGAS